MHDGHDGARGADHRRGLVRHHGEEDPDQRAEDSRAEIEGEKVAAAVEGLHLARNDPEEPHVHDQVQMSAWKNVAVSNCQSL